MVVGRLHVLTDYHFQQRFSHAQLAELAIAGGADTIQFRDKSGHIRHVLRQAAATMNVCHENGVAMIVDDRVDIALAIGATGVHLGQTDFPVSLARTVLGDDRMIGATATTVDQALRAQEDGADYVGFGPVFPTASKSNPASVKGLEGLRRVCAELSIPVIAIAGITHSRIHSVLDAGAHGVAVMTAISKAEDPAHAARQFRDEIDAYFVSG